VPLDPHPWWCERADSEPRLDQADRRNLGHHGLIDEHRHGFGLGFWLGLKVEYWFWFPFRYNVDSNWFRRDRGLDVDRHRRDRGLNVDMNLIRTTLGQSVSSDNKSGAGYKADPDGRGLERNKAEHRGD
jgi:hypothetical protein